MAERIAEPAGVAVTRERHGAQLALHLDPADARAFADAAGVALAEAMPRVAATGEWRSLRLAPDEWLLLGPAGDAARIAGAARGLAAPHSLVDVSSRMLALRIEGPAAAALVASACPLDLAHAAFPPGAATRTLFGKVTVVLERLCEQDCFRMQYGRSYDAYVTELIRTAAPDLVA